MKKTIIALIASLFTAGSLIAAPQAVVFDWGNVIGFSDRMVVVNFMCDSFRFSEDEFECANAEKRLAMKFGKSDVDFWREFSVRKGIELPVDWPQQYRRMLKESIGADSQMYVLIDEIKEQGIRVGMLSNIDDRYTKLIRECGYYEPFDPCLLSCEMGLEKPDPKAYQLLLNRLNLAPQDVVFIDDKGENVEAAKALGIDAILFESRDQLKAELLQRNALK